MRRGVYAPIAYKAGTDIKFNQCRYRLPSKHNLLCRVIFNSNEIPERILRFEAGRVGINGREDRRRVEWWGMNRSVVRGDRTCRLRIGFNCPTRCPKFHSLGDMVSECVTWHSGTVRRELAHKRRKSISHCSKVLLAIPACD